MKKIIPCLVLLVILASCEKKHRFSCDVDPAETPATDSARIFVPNAFSPNGDGLNDVFFMATRHIRSLQWEIYDEEGNVLYSTQDIAGRWVPGRAFDPGMTLFHYKLHATTDGGNTIARCGDLYVYTCVPQGFSMEHIVFSDQYDPAMPDGYLKETSAENFQSCQ